MDSECILKMEPRGLLMAWMRVGEKERNQGGPGSLGSSNSKRWGGCGWAGWGGPVRREMSTRPHVRQQITGDMLPPHWVSGVQKRGAPSGTTGVISSQAAITQNTVKDTQWECPHSQVWGRGMAGRETESGGTPAAWGPASLVRQEGDTVTVSRNLQSD